MPALRSRVARSAHNSLCPPFAVSVAIALPASLFLASCFSIANDSEAPESWLEWLGWRKFVFGMNAHRRWHYTGPLGQPVRHVKWFLRSVGAPPPETAINLWHSLVAWLTGNDPPWVEEWREAVEAEAEAEVEAEASSASHVLESHVKHADHDCASTRSSVRSARALARYKRFIALVGLISVYVTWAIFSWCVPSSRISLLPVSQTPWILLPPRRFIFVRACRSCISAAAMR